MFKVGDRVLYTGSPEFGPASIIGWYDLAYEPTLVSLCFDKANPYNLHDCGGKTPKHRGYWVNTHSLIFYDEAKQRENKYYDICEKVKYLDKKFKERVHV